MGGAECEQQICRCAPALATQQRLGQQHSAVKQRQGSCVQYDLALQAEQFTALRHRQLPCLSLSQTMGLLGVRCVIEGVHEQPSVRNCVISGPQA